MHQNMTREDLKYLANRTFACYFWSKCFSRRLSEYETWIEEGLFNNLVCIPTENSVQKPELLYAPRITASYAVRAKAPQWEEKVPCKAIVESIDNRDARDLFERLHFCTVLSFEDCLYYLARVTERREEESDYRYQLDACCFPHTIANWLQNTEIRQPLHGETVRVRKSTSQNYLLFILTQNRRGISFGVMSL